jgi:hypothetical protein
MINPFRIEARDIMSQRRITMLQLSRETIRCALIALRDINKRYSTEENIKAQEEIEIALGLKEKHND